MISKIDNDFCNSNLEYLVALEEQLSQELNICAREDIEQLANAIKKIKIVEEAIANITRLVASANNQAIDNLLGAVVKIKDEAKSDIDKINKNELGASKPETVFSLTVNRAEQAIKLASTEAYKRFNVFSDRFTKKTSTLNNSELAQQQSFSSSPAVVVLEPKSEMIRQLEEVEKNALKNEKPVLRAYCRYARLEARTSVKENATPQEVLNFVREQNSKRMGAEQAQSPAMLESMELFDKQVVNALENNFHLSQSITDVEYDLTEIKPSSS